MVAKRNSSAEVVLRNARAHYAFGVGVPVPDPVPGFFDNRRVAGGKIDPLHRGIGKNVVLAGDQGPLAAWVRVEYIAGVDALAPAIDDPSAARIDVKDEQPQERNVIAARNFLR